MKESDIQEEICDYLDNKKKTHLFRYFHVPNGGKHKVWYLHKLVRMGMKSGVPDLVLEFPDGKTVMIPINPMTNLLILYCFRNTKAANEHIKINLYSCVNYETNHNLNRTQKEMLC